MKQKDKGRKWATYIMGGIIVLILLAYYPVFGSYFVNYDDSSYVTANSHVKSGITGDSIKWAFTTFYFYNWHPLTWISHMLDVQLFGLNPMGHHVTSLLFHIVNSVLLFTLFRRMTGALWKSLCIAGLFALHPLHVESVAWVADRKDLLSTFFWFLTMLAYVDYARKQKLMTYLLCVLLFILGLMAKPMLVTLPLLLLLMDYWPLRRSRWGMTDLAERQHTHRSALAALMIVIIMICSVFTNLQTRRWHDSVTLFRHALEVTENNSLAHKNLAAALAQQGNLIEALHHASESLRIQPEPLEYVSQGWLYLQLGHYEKAAEACRNSIGMAPHNNDKAHFLLGVSYVYLDNYQSAVTEYRFLRRSNSSYVDPLLDLMNKAGMALPAN